MPRIPTRDSLAQLTPRPTGGIVQAPRDFVGGALVDVGNDIYVKAEQERKQQSALELAKARSEWNTALLTEQSAYTLDQNPDYGNWNKKYEPRSKVWQKRAAENISDPQVRQQFLYETEDDRVRVGLNITGTARDIGKQARLTAANTSIEQMVNNAASVDDANAAGVFGDIKATLKDMVDTGLITPEEAASRSIKYGQQFAAIRARDAVEKDPATAASALRGDKASASTLIKQFEGFRTTPYWDVNAYRTGYGSDTITTASGAVIKVKPGMQVSRADAERDLERRIGEFQQTIIKQTSNAAWERLSPNVQAAITSFAYNYGSLTDSLAKAVKSGDTEAIAQAIEARAGDNGGVNQRRRLEEAAVVRGADGNTYAAIGQRPAWAGMLSANDRQQFLSAAEREVERLDLQRTTQDKVAQVELTDRIANDLSSVLNTGQPTDIDSAAVLRELGPEKHKAWLEAREDAGQIYSQTENLAMMGDAQIAEVLARNVPQPSSENYDRKLKVYEEIQKRADAITKERRDNPAKAALRMPDVTRALSEAQNPRTSSPQKVQAFVRQLMATQSTFDVPRSAIAPVPDEWAYEIGRVFLTFPAELNSSNADQVAQALTATYQQMEQVYGEYADDVIAHSIEKSKALSKDMSKHVTTLLKSVASGRPITRAEREAAMLADQQAADQTSSSWWNPTTWFGGDDASPTDPDRMPTKDEIASALSMEDDQARSEALQALVDEYGEAAVTAARTMYQ